MYGQCKKCTVLLPRLILTHHGPFRSFEVFPPVAFWSCYRWLLALGIICIVRQAFLLSKTSRSCKFDTCLSSRGQKDLLFFHLSPVVAGMAHYTRELGGRGETHPLTFYLAGVADPRKAISRIGSLREPKETRATLWMRCTQQLQGPKRARKSQMKDTFKYYKMLF